MPTVVFSGDPRAPGTDPAECVMFGVTFPLSEPVEAPDEIADRLRTHSHFTVGESEHTRAVRSDDTPQVRAVHRGRGSYSIIDRDGEIIEGLSKQQAADFNAMTLADRLAFIEASK